MVKVREIPPTVDSGQLLAGAQFVDAFSLEVDGRALNARHAAGRMLIVPAMLRQVLLLFDISRGLFRCACRCWWRLRPFSDATLEVLQILPHLLQREPEREKSLRDVAGPAAGRPDAQKMPCPHCGRPYRTLVKRDYGIQMRAISNRAFPCAASGAVWHAGALLRRTTSDQ